MGSSGEVESKQKQYGKTPRYTRHFSSPRRPMTIEHSGNWEDSEKVHQLLTVTRQVEHFYFAQFQKSRQN